MSREAGPLGHPPLWIVFLYLSFGGFFLAGLTTYLRSSLSRGFQASLDEVSFIGIFRADLVQGRLSSGRCWASS
ncbi:MAG: hypothetical protein MZV70_17010 [Desulfobacterales bacterium]|nr:hypothetical protein [Desulfobacterales bacterium]